MTQQEVEVVREQIVHVPKIIEQKRIPQRTVEQVVDIPIPQERYSVLLAFTPFLFTAPLRLRQG